MRYFYWALIALAVVLAIVLLICLIIHLRRKWACRKVAALCAAEKILMLDEALAPFGFVYEKKCDLITSGMYCWQREMGYCYQYDAYAPAMNMVFECEPIYFNYDGKKWLLEMWKGQYGCTTGAEIGLYVNETADLGERPEKLFYQCAGDEERLQMQFTLYRNNRVIMERKALHWWLTGFLVGEYCRPEELLMEVCICFPNMAMRNAFYQGLLRAGYHASQICMEQCRVCIVFDRPCSPQPHKFCKGYIWCKCRRNRSYCKLYCRVTKCFRTTLDKICFLGFCFPRLYRLVIRIGMKCSRRKLGRYSRRKI